MDTAAGQDMSGMAQAPDSVRERFFSHFRYGQVGRCVSSVTHEINNHLGAMLAYAELVQLDAGISDDSKRMLGELTQAVKECSGLVAAFTAVSRRDKPSCNLVDPVRVAAQVLDIRRYAMRVAQVDPQTELEQAATIMGDQPKLMMAFMHLLMNAEEAVGGQPGAQVRVFAGNVGDNVELRVWDSGPPIDEALRERLFEPFYTTKDGHHLGLGLPVARAIARLHEGDAVYEPDKGFILRLPKRSSLKMNA